MTGIQKILRIFIVKDLNQGTMHWLSQRVWSTALIPLTVIFIFSFVQNVRLGYEENITFYQSPVNALLTLLFLSLSLLHFKQGAEVVIEDYVSDKLVLKIFMKTNQIFFFLANFLLIFTFVRLIFDFNWS